MVWHPSEETTEAAEDLVKLVDERWAKPRGEQLGTALKDFLARIVMFAYYEADAPYSEESAIPGELIAWLVGDPEASVLLPAAGFQICKTLITGNLTQPIPRAVLPLYIVKCRFEEPVIVSGHFGNLSFRGSTFCGGLKIQETHVAGGLDLRELKCPGSLSIRSTRVATNMQLSTSNTGDWKNCLKEWHVDVQGLAVGGDFDMTGLVIDGPSSLSNDHLLNFRDVTVEGSLVARSVKLASVRGYAIHARHLQVKGDVLLDEGLAASGGIAVCDSTFDGAFLLDGAVLTRRDEPCLRLSDTRIGQSLFMRGITADGTVSLEATVIGGEVLTERSHLHGDPALVLTDARISSSVIFGPGFLATGAVYLDGATVAGTVNLAGSNFENAGGIALSMCNAHVHADLRLGGEAVSRDAKVRSDSTSYEGDVTLRGARIEGTLSVEGIHWDRNASLELNHVQAGCLSGVPTVAVAKAGGVDEYATWPAPGNLDLREFTYRAIDFRGSFQQAALLKWLQLQLPGSPPLKDESPPIKGPPRPVGETGPKGKAPDEEALGSCTCRDKESRLPPDLAPLDESASKFETPAKPTEGSGEAAERLGIGLPDRPPEPTDNRVPVMVVDEEEWIDPRGFSEGSYHQLATVLEEMGRPDPAQWILERKTRDLADYFWEEWSWFRRVWDLAFWEVSRSGYRPRRAGFGALLLAGVGALLFWGGRRLGLIVSIKGTHPYTPRRPFYAVMYAFDIAFPIIDFQQAKHWVPGTAPDCTWWIKHPRLGKWAVAFLWGWVWVSIALGWFCATLFATGLLGLRG